MKRGKAADLSLTVEYLLIIILSSDINCSISSYAVIMFLQLLARDNIYHKRATV